MSKKNFLVWDDVVEETFDRDTAIYFEGLQYWQRLNKDEWFTYPAKTASKVTKLHYRKQLKARKVLEAGGWIEVKRMGDHQGGSQIYIRITKLAKELQGKRHFHGLADLYKSRKTFVKGF